MLIHYDTKALLLLYYNIIDQSLLICVTGLLYISKYLNTLNSNNIIQVERSPEKRHLSLNTLHQLKVKHLHMQRLENNHLI